MNQYLYESTIFNQGYSNNMYSYLLPNFVDNNDDDNISNEQCDECDDDVSKCMYVEKLFNSMKLYNGMEHDIISDIKTVNLCLSYYFHLISNHDEDFEYIYEKLGGFCNNAQCTRFQRNYRNRNKILNQIYDTKITEEIVNQQIIDKIHCYFMHSYDIGYRLNKKEIDNINSVEIKHDDDDKTNIDDFIDNKLSKRNEILSTKHVYKKSNKFTTDFDANINAGDHKKDKKDKNDKIYSYGFNFDYGTKWHHHSAQNISCGKYENLKEEMMHSDSIGKAVMNKEQFDNENNKAERHHNSWFGRKYASKYYHDHDPTFYPDQSIPQSIPIQALKFHLPKEKKTLSQNHLLSVMIYCNFDKISEQFLT